MAEPTDKGTTIMSWLEEVKDPEIPVLSVVDLGIVTKVEATGDKVRVTITPTFVGCPALDMLKGDIRKVLEAHGEKEVQVDVTIDPPWTTDRISEKGRLALKQFGLAPPPSRKLFEDLDILEHARCPRCDGVNTELRSPFGSTLCRAIYYCADCRESFEQFKPL